MNRTSSILLALSILAAPAAAQITTVRVSVKRVLGHSTAGSTTPAAASPLWNLVCTSNGAPCTSALGCAGTAFDANIIQQANSILVGQGTIPANAARIQLKLVEFVDLLDPGYPASMFDVDLGINAAGVPRGKVALETAAELQPGRFAFNPTAINVYLVNSLTGGFSGFCSFPTPALPPGVTQNDDIVFLSGTQFFGPCSTTLTDQIAQLLAHEIGHYYGLFHTFESVANGPENAGCPPTINSQNLGDKVFDTAFDPNNATQLGTMYTACLTARFNLLNNVMNNYVKPFSQTLLTIGQRQRIFFDGSLSFLTLRNHVVDATPIPTITSAVQISPTQIVVNGTDLLGPFTGVQSNPLWRATLGSALCTGSGTSAVCVSDIGPSGDLAPGSGASSTSMTFTFPTTIPPGRHDVCITRRVGIGGIPSAEEVIAVGLNALPVAPFVDLDVVNASAGQAVFTVGTTAPGTSYLLALGEFTPTPVVVTTAPYPVLLVVPSPNLLVSNPPLVSGPTGVDMSGVFFFGLPSGGFPSGLANGAQILELGPGGPVGPFSNALALRIP